MSFEAVWGFDPEAVLRVQQSFRRTLDYEHEEGGEGVEGIEIIAFAEIPPGRDLQVKELRRMFRL